jgi:hypothetical protein
MQRLGMCDTNGKSYQVFLETEQTSHCLDLSIRSNCIFVTTTASWIDRENRKEWHLKEIFHKIIVGNSGTYPCFSQLQMLFAGAGNVPVLKIDFQVRAKGQPTPQIE